MRTKDTAIVQDQKAPGLERREILLAAEAQSGNTCRDLNRWRDLRSILGSARIKARVAAGMRESRARVAVEDELDAEEDRLEELERECVELARRDDARYATERADMNARAERMQLALDGKLVGAGLSKTESFFAAIEALLPAAQAIREVNDQIARHQPSGQLNRAFVVSPQNYVQRGDLIELAERAVTLHFKLVRQAPDRRTW